MVKVGRQKSDGVVGGGGVFPSSKLKPKTYKVQCLKKSILDERGGERYPVCQREGKKGGGGVVRVFVRYPTHISWV